MAYNEDTLVQQTTADYLEQQLGWRNVYAYNTESFGAEGMLGRHSDKDVVLTRILGEKLIELNPGLPMEAYQDAMRQIVEASVGQTAMATNKEKYSLLRDGVKVEFRNAQGEMDAKTLRMFDFQDATNNDFLAVRELWIRGDLYRRRADIIGFVNGIPLLFIECKNIHKNLRNAYDNNLKDYQDTIPHLFHHNAFLLLANGTEARIGALGGKYEHFYNWKRLEESEPGVVDMETLLKGVCDKRNFLDLFESFILFDETPTETGTKTVKIVARNHQFIGVNRAIKGIANRDKNAGKLGVFWHTQGSGKSYSMLFFTRKVHRRIGGNFTFIIVTDREDLDSQIYKTYVSCDVVSEKDDARASGGSHLKGLLTQHKSYVFTLVQKFNEKVEPNNPYSKREDIIVISDEAHRTQYGTLALNMRNALPFAGYIGFTGTPLMSGDEITRQMFGEYVSTYNFQRAVEDGATVPLYYDARGDKLKVATDDLNQRVADKLAGFDDELADDPDAQRRLEQALGKDYHVITAGERLDRIARDFVRHYAAGWESGKAMFVCIDKVTCVRMYDLIKKYWQEHIQRLAAERDKLADDQEIAQRNHQLHWMTDTKFGVVVSEEQNEQDRFKKWGLDITPHRKLMKEGFEIAGESKRLDMESAFKSSEHPFRVAIVCAMWLTGFDVKSLGTLYLDKPLKAHTLMQAIARANRVDEGKTNGLIVDYCGILKNLRKALATFAAGSGNGGEDGGIDPTQPQEDLLTNLDESLAGISEYLAQRQAPLGDVITKTGFARNAAIENAKNAVNENDEERKRFMVMARDAFGKFKACVHLQEVNTRRDGVEAVKIIYKSLSRDVEHADISHILQALREEVDAAIQHADAKLEAKQESVLYDISQIDFDKLAKEFQRTKKKNTTVQNLKAAIESRLARLLALNPMRKDIQAKFEEFVAEYNNEKDRVTIETSFQQLLVITKALNEEERRAVSMGLDEETLALFDLLSKPELDKAGIEKLKAVVVGLLSTLKTRLADISDWQATEANRDTVRLTIHDYLYSDATGLPVDSYDEEDVDTLTDNVFQHVWRAYPMLPSPLYAH
ncbi:MULTISPECIES: type I restriction endonuclease subunit R [unclassified Caballeronia]|uniref:type I restriction endonuclease subunit R n=1 Tax=unclassified Caballeronia TaxID=2646786 RepID=UPI0028677D18|nr:MULTISPECIES: type I restriction endonuclease subunit R [unclassified Caballeronia]MDR5752145.1 type I restriction endonuclease subunit R [Caballeronia sp. LZ024]MDR5843714.1 type I restriction endonuclease subunit R [Caballeronia sp. LZ031]